MSKRKAEPTESDRVASSSSDAQRKLPNIIITGTPGTGKTTTCELLKVAVPEMQHVNIGALVKDKGLHDGFDEEWQSYILDEDKVCDELETTIHSGGYLVDHHGCDFFPEDWFDLVVVLRTDNSVLGNRLEARGYSERKITENIEAEIMQVVLEEAAESYAAEKVMELQSNSMTDMQENVERLRAWILGWSPAKRIKAKPVEDSSGPDDDDELDE